MLENGFEFIYQSINNLSIIEDDNPDDDIKRRLLKYSILHLSSGIELIFKSRLFNENWSYIFADMNSANKEMLNRGDIKTADSETIIKRLNNLCSIEFNNSEIKSLSGLRRKRNKIEHYKFDESLQSVESSINECLSILIKFIVENYDISKFNENEVFLFTEIKKITNRLKDHYSESISLANMVMKSQGIKDYIVICPNCQTKFLFCDGGETKCYYCDYEDDSESAAENYINNVLNMDRYSTVKDGGIYPLYQCPECNVDALVNDKDDTMYMCFSCGTVYKHNKIGFCDDCGTPYIIKYDDDYISLCNGCINYRLDDD